MARRFEDRNRRRSQGLGQWGGNQIWEWMTWAYEMVRTAIRCTPISTRLLSFALLSDLPTSPLSKRSDTQRRRGGGALRVAGNGYEGEKGSTQEGYFSRTRWLERQDRFRCLPKMTKTITVSKFDLRETESKGWRLMKLAQSHKLTKYNTIHAHEDSRKVVQYNLVYNQIVFIMLSWGFTSDMNKDKTN